MKVSLNWIKEYVKIPSDLELSKLVYDLTMATVEVEGTEELAQRFDNVIVGVVKEVATHPNADKLKVCKTDIGNGDIREIVCGGTNLEKDMVVAVGLPGSKVRWHGEGELIELTKTKIRGVESYGMICAAAEIGLFDLFPEGETEIMDLSKYKHIKAGTPLAEALGLDDVILEIDNKSLTNRPDLWGHYGIAREISAFYNLPFNEIAVYSVPNTADLRIDVKDTERCPRYVGVKIEGLSVGGSPYEIQKRIWSVGMRPINNIVDITNYVMLATGQPTHAFDSDNIKDNIIVRLAENKEKLMLLNGEELELTNKDLVIADGDSAVGLAGVMGGEKDSVLPETSKVILEIANFEPLDIRRTAARYEIRTESATRFEKGIDPERCDITLSLAMALFKEFFPSMQVTGFKDNYPKKLKRNEIEISLDWLTKRLGKTIPNKEISDILGRLGFDVEFKNEVAHIIVPTWRSTGDISIADDILEEIARMHGFENFEPAPIKTTFTNSINQLDVDIDRKVKEYLAFRCGMQEIFTYPWISNEYIEATFGSYEGMFSLASPPSPNERFIRSSLIPNLCKAVSENLRFINEFAIFESAMVFFNQDFKSEYDPKELLPLQRKHMAGACVGDPKNINELFRKVKGMIEFLPRSIHIEELTFEKEEKPIWADDTVWLNIKHDGERIGNMALLSKKASLDLGIKKSAVMIFEIDVDSLKPLPSRTNKFENLPEYPMIDYDLSLMFDASVKWEDIYENIVSKKSTDDLLRGVSFVDEYRGKQVPEDKKSVTFRLVIGSLKKTLTSEEVENYVGIIVKRLGKTLNAELRQ
ncbi:MAG: phenylalanine--tRNA ligase subunit beta [Oscillospiraceae bacterium]|nr:phenylalanine--tRNA ligase subunit beta [Oscillospiraceae bacterium]